MDFLCLWSTQSGRAKACARRCTRIIRSNCNVDNDEGTSEISILSKEDLLHRMNVSKKNNGKGEQSTHSEDRRSSETYSSSPLYSCLLNDGCSFDDFGADNFLSLGDFSRTKKGGLTLIMFVSTTGDGEQCDTIQNCWKALLQKSLPSNHFSSLKFCLFCLGDRAYGPNDFCAAGRKLASRLIQLGAILKLNIGYGDDGTPKGGVFADLDTWINNDLLPGIMIKTDDTQLDKIELIPTDESEEAPYQVSPIRDHVPDEEAFYCSQFFCQMAPKNVYDYHSNNQNAPLAPIRANLLSNTRITAEDWSQDVRHLSYQVITSLEREERGFNYMAGDVAVITPENSPVSVQRFISQLPTSIQEMADLPLEIKPRHSSLCNKITPWPSSVTLRTILQKCAGINCLPEREDLRLLSAFCTNEDHALKLIEMSEPSLNSDLYVDYILREKRTFVDVFHDFDSLASNESSELSLTIEFLLAILPPLIPRHFSIASAPYTNQKKHSNSTNSFYIDLCVAIVSGTTPLKRKFEGVCSNYLARQTPFVDDSRDLQINGNKPYSSSSSSVRLWIRPGSFEKLPLDFVENSNIYQQPVMCIGAGTGVAPLRGLLREREYRRHVQSSLDLISHPNPLGENDQNNMSENSPDNILVFGCRKKMKDFLYKDEWAGFYNNCNNNNNNNGIIKNRQSNLKLITAFSQDQKRKEYVQHKLKTSSEIDVVNHLINRNGAIYIAGGAKMARAVKEEITELLSKQHFSGNEAQAKMFLRKLNRKGLFRVEAWS